MDLKDIEFAGQTLQLGLQTRVYYRVVLQHRVTIEGVTIVYASAESTSSFAHAENLLQDGIQRAVASGKNITEDQVTLLVW